MIMFGGLFGARLVRLFLPEVKSVLVRAPCNGAH